MSKVRKTLIQNGFLRLPEVRLLKKLYGGDGVLAAIACYLAMTDSSEGWLDKDTVICEAETEGVKKVDAWLEFVTKKNIITCTSGKYTNTHVDRDRKSYKAKLEREQNRYKTEAEKRQKKDKEEAEPVYVYDLDIKDLDNKGLRQHEIYKHCWYSEVDIDQFAKPKEFITRCFQKLNGWIESAKADPGEFQKRQKTGAYGLTGAFQSWVIATIEKEQSQGSSFKKEKVSALELLEKRKFKQQLEEMQNG